MPEFLFYCVIMFDDGSLSISRHAGFLTEDDARTWAEQNSGNYNKYVAVDENGKVV